MGGILMEKVIYLHIGTPKTGTTSIQDFLYLNRTVLANKGYSYKLMPMRYDRAEKTRNAVFLNRRRLRSLGLPSEKLQERVFSYGLKQIREQLKNFRAVILTDEALWAFFMKTDCKILERVKAFADENNAVLKLVVYFRPQEDLLESTYRQKIKKYQNGVTFPEWNTFFDNPEKWPRMDYYAGVCRMSEIVGKDNIIVRVYDRSCFPDGKVEADFLQAIGLEYTDEYKLEEEKNASLSANYIELKRILNQLGSTKKITEKEIMSVQGAAINCSTSLRKAGHDTFMSNEQRERLRDSYKEGNQKLLEEYLPGRDTLFPDSGEKPVWNRDNPDLFEDTVLLLGYLILKQNKEISRLKKTVYLRLKLYDGCRKLWNRLKHFIMRN